MRSRRKVGPDCARRRRREPPQVLILSVLAALILYAAIGVAAVLIKAVLMLSRLAELATVQQHNALLALWFRRALEFAAMTVWLVYVTQRLAIGHALWKDLKMAVDARISIGTINFTLGHVLLFALTIWIAFVVSRVLRFVLEVEVYPHGHKLDLLPA